MSSSQDLRDRGPRADEDRARPETAESEGFADPAHIRWRYKHISVFLCLVVLGLVLQIVSFDLKTDHARAASMLEQLGTLVLISGLWSSIYEFLLRREFLSLSTRNSERVLTSNRGMNDTFKAESSSIMGKIEDTALSLTNAITYARKEEQLGLVEARASAEGYSYDDLILSSRKLIVVLNDEWAWVSFNWFTLEKRFQDPDKSTTFYLLNPGSPMLSVLSRKIGTPAEALRDKIRETITQLHTLSSPTTKLRVLGHYLYNSYSMFLGDTYAVVTLYFNSKARRPVPLFRFQDREGPCFYKQLREDVEILALDSTELNHDSELFRR